MDRAGRPSDDRFEYRDLTIPLSLRLEGSRRPARRELAAFHGWDGVVVRHLQAAARDGWQADEAADWDSLAAAGRFATETEPGDRAGAEAVTVYTSVTIRLRRLARPGGAAAGEPAP